MAENLISASQAADLAAEARSQLTDAARTLEKVARELDHGIASAAESITAALRHGNKVLLCGNGGSAADAQHLAAEWVGRLESERAPLPALALTTDSSILTAVSNDYGFEHVYARQIQGLAHPGDVLVAISTSGNSPNVLEAVRAARARGCFTIAFTGRSGGQLAPLVDLALKVPVDRVSRVQEAHITMGHVICSLVEQRLGVGRSVPEMIDLGTAARST